MPALLGKMFYPGGENRILNKALHSFVKKLEECSEPGEELSSGEFNWVK